LSNVIEQEEMLEPEVCSYCEFEWCQCPVKQQYFVDFDDNGSVSGFYVDEIHGDNIPASAIPITIEQWQEYVADSHLYKLDGETIRLKTADELLAEQAAQPPIAKSIQQELAEMKQLLADLASLQLEV